MMLYQLWDYFGLVGIASILLWIGAVVLAGVSLWSRRRTVGLLAAVVLAGGAFLTAKINSAKISDYEVDRSDVIAAAHQQMEESRARDVREQTADVQVASAGDPNDANKPKSEYAYRKIRGKRTREVDANDDPNQAGWDEMAFLAEREAEKEDPDIRLMPADDVARANQWDRVNLFLVRWILLLSGALLVVDYVGRFVPALRKALPEKPRPIPAVRTASGEEMRRYLEQAIQNGETFIYCTTEDPWPQGDVPRLPVNFVWPMEKITYDAESPPFSSEFVFESAWFRDYCFVIEGEQTADGLLSDLADWLRMRYHAGAETPCPVHIVWEFCRPDESLLRELAFFAQEAHIRLLIAE